jgi:hypothetical protein
MNIGRFIVTSDFERDGMFINFRGDVLGVLYISPRRSGTGRWIDIIRFLYKFSDGSRIDASSIL